MTEDAKKPRTLKPWTLKNVPADIRNAAIDAARRANTTIGEWVSRKLLEAAQADAKMGTALAVTTDTAQAGTAVAVGTPPVTRLELVSSAPAEAPPGLANGMAQLAMAADIAVKLQAIAVDDKASQTFKRSILTAMRKQVSQ